MLIRFLLIAIRRGKTPRVLNFIYCRSRPSCAASQAHRMMFSGRRFMAKFCGDWIEKRPRNVAVVNGRRESSALLSGERALALG